MQPQGTLTPGVPQRGHLQLFDVLVVERRDGQVGVLLPAAPVPATWNALQGHRVQLPNPDSRLIAELEAVRTTSMGMIGVCALDVKARSKPSRNILTRLQNNGEFDVVVFGDKVILDEGQFLSYDIGSLLTFINSG